MDTKDWKRNTRVDSVLHVVLFVLGLVVFGVSAFETHVDRIEMARVDTTTSVS